jgi:hypothetical protein
MPRGLHSGAVLADMEIDQPAPQLVAVHPIGDGRVVRVGHQEGEAETAEQAFGGPLPFPLSLAHADQFAREGHALFWQPQGSAELFADADLVAVDVAAPALQALDLGL